MKTIASPANPLVKTVRRLQLHPRREPEGRLVLEGMKLAREALSHGLAVEQALFSTVFAEAEAGRELLSEMERFGVPWAVLQERAFRRLSSLETPEGVLLVVRKPRLPLDAAAGNLLVVAVGVQDPGNLGAIARVAEASGADGLVCCRGTADPYQPKALRGSMGSLLRLPLFEAGEPEQALAALSARGYRAVACLPRGGVEYYRADLGGKLALLLGSEGQGLPDSIRETADLSVSVPMKSTVESLNVAVVAGLILYEAARQRGFFPRPGRKTG